jgi:hypothetical protein
MERVIPYLSVTEVVDDYMISAMDYRRKNILTYLVHAKWIWKDLMWSTIWQTVSKLVQVKQKDGLLYIDTPPDMLRFISLTRPDARGRLRPFLTDDAIDHIPPTFENGIICPTCGESNELGQCVSDITVVTSQVTILGDNYINKTWKRLEANGNLTEIREVWALDVSDADNPVATKTVLTKKVCSFQVKDCGCLVNCAENRQLVELYCGSLCVSQKKILARGRDWAKIKVVDGKIFFSHRGAVPDFVLLTYQTNGECGLEEIMIPEYAVTAMNFGIHWRCGALAPASVVSPGEKRERSNEWAKAKQALQEFLNPIIMEEFLAGQMSIPKWGGTTIWQKDDPTCLLEERRLSNVDDVCCLTEASIIELINERVANISGTGLQGPKGDKGDPGDTPTIDLDYHHDQSVAASTWTINHNLGFEPSGIEVKDKTGIVLIGYTVTHTSLNQTVITHGFAVAGDAWLS